MIKTKVWMYPDDNSANAAIVKYIRENRIVKTDWIDFWNDREILNFSFFGMKDPKEWFGSMSGVELTNADGECIIFASWFTPFYGMEFEDCLNKVVDAVTLFSPNDDFRD